MRERATGKSPNLRVINGSVGQQVSLPSKAIEARKRFVDEVMERIGDSVPLKIVEGGKPDGKEIS